MPSHLRRGLATKAPLLLLPCALLCACTPAIVLTPPAIPCREIVAATGMLEPTPGAALPANDTVGEIAAFGVRQTGQVDKANADKAGVARILQVCDEWRDHAAKAVKRRRILGMF
ncbi:MAG: hypothetical protein ACKVOB_02375 [Sphingomonas sp.]